MILLDIPFPKTCMECPLVVHSITKSCVLLDGDTPYDQLVSGRRTDCKIKKDIPEPDRSNDKLLEESGFEL